MQGILFVPLPPNNLPSNLSPKAGFPNPFASLIEPKGKFITTPLRLSVCQSRRPVRAFAAADDKVVDVIPKKFSSPLLRGSYIKRILQQYGVPEKICALLASNDVVFSCDEITDIVAQYYEDTKQIDRLSDLPTLFSQLQAMEAPVCALDLLQETFMEAVAEFNFIKTSRNPTLSFPDDDWGLYMMQALYTMRHYLSGSSRDDNFNWKDFFFNLKDHYFSGSSKFSPPYVFGGSYSYKFDPSSASTCHLGLENFSVSEQLMNPRKESYEQEGFYQNAWPYGLGSNIILSKASVIQPLTAIGAAATPFLDSKIVLLMLAMGLFAANIPLGMRRQHKERFSPGWFTAALATVPFVIPMMLLCNPSFMPKPIMLLAFGMSVLLGQGIGSMLERFRLNTLPRLASLFATIRLEASIPLPNHLLELDISSHKKSLRVTSMGAKSMTPASQPMLKQILWAVSMAAKCVWQQQAHGLSNWVFTPQNTALTLGVWLFRLINYISDTPSTETETMPLRIKVSVSSWSCLILGVAPGKFSIEVSQERALPPTSSPALL